MLKGGKETSEECEEKKDGTDGGDEHPFACVCVCVTSSSHLPPASRDFQGQRMARHLVPCVLVPPLLPSFRSCTSLIITCER